MQSASSTSRRKNSSPRVLARRFGIGVTVAGLWVLASCSAGGGQTELPFEDNSAGYTPVSSLGGSGGTTSSTGGTSSSTGGTGGTSTGFGGSGGTGGTSSSTGGTSTGFGG